MLTHNEMVDYFQKSQNKKIYRKKVNVLARQFDLSFRGWAGKETIMTVVNGEVETISTLSLKEENYAVRNFGVGLSSETYIMSKEDFERNYEKTETKHYMENNYWTEYLPKRKIIAVPFNSYSIIALNDIYKKTNPGSDMVGRLCRARKFLNYRNEEMMINFGDYLASDASLDFFQIYRIEKNTFLNTYEPSS